MEGVFVFYMGDVVDTGYWMLDAGYRMRDDGYWRLQQLLNINY